MWPEPGAALPELRTDVSAEPMKVMALLLRDVNPIHFDVDVVSALGLGDRVINQGPLNAAYVWNMLDAWLGATDEVVGLSLRYVSNARAGDVVLTGGLVERVDEQAGIAECTVWLRHESGGDVLRGVARVRCRS